MTKWLNHGIPPAEWAGNSVPVLLAIYARCVSGQLSELKKRMEAGRTSPSGLTRADEGPENVSVDSP
ncbi:MAG TPA: hypothetical protein VN520_23680 [Streptomyces sp.]|uniref:hypothetical protein n=1 Tax=Streptomyces sp. TaxID=1931 RepID=UPI002BE2FF3A|nr:hypothetical protein [Streptomyces sp.]HWU09344.1 hypothetical protein [Streptomyces sp.]